MSRVKIHILQQRVDMEEFISSILSILINSMPQVEATKATKKSEPIAKGIKKMMTEDKNNVKDDAGF